MNPGLSFSLSQTVVGLEVLNDKLSAVVLRKNRKKWTVYKTDKKRILDTYSNIEAHKITEFFNELYVLYFCEDQNRDERSESAIPPFPYSPLSCFPLS